MKGSIRATPSFLLVIAASGGLLACGIGDAIVTGVGNTGNRFYATPVIEELAEQLASSEVIPPVTDDMLQSSFEAIAKRADEGDPQSALILFRLADAQRKAQED